MNAKSLILNNFILDPLKSFRDHINKMIEDSGQGISDEDKDHIFSRFYRTASARAQENQGSGLGLAIVKHLVNSLNGEVGIESKPNKGSIFGLQS